MKSPWKYLVELASFGRTNKVSEKPDEIAAAEGDVLPLPPETEVSIPVALARDAALPVTQADKVADKRDAEVAEISVDPAGENEDAPVTMDHRMAVSAPTPAPERVRSPKSRPKKTQRRSRKTNVRGIEVTATVDYGDASSSPPQRPLTFFDEIVALDKEVSDLRRQLATKLLLQNTQLKKMLERYDVS